MLMCQSDYGTSRILDEYMLHEYTDIPVHVYIKDLCSLQTRSFYTCTFDYTPEQFSDCKTVNILEN